METLLAAFSDLSFTNEWRRCRLPHISLLPMNGDVVGCTPVSILQINGGAVGCIFWSLFHQWIKTLWANLSYLSFTNEWRRCRLHSLISLLQKNGDVVRLHSLISLFPWRRRGLHSHISLLQINVDAVGCTLISLFYQRMETMKTTLS